MDEIEIDVNQKYDGRRRAVGEEEWNAKHEELAKEWGEKAQQASIDHNIMAKVFKKKHVGVGLPALLLPVAMAPLTTTLSDYDGIQYANMSAFLISAVLNAVHGFFSFDKKYQQHMDYSARYSDLNTDIKLEMVKARNFRVSADEFLTKVQMKFDNLGANAPDL